MSAPGRGPQSAALCPHAHGEDLEGADERRGLRLVEADGARLAGPDSTIVSSSREKTRPVVGCRAGAWPATRAPSSPSSEYLSQQFHAIRMPSPRSIRCKVAMSPPTAPSTSTRGAGRASGSTASQRDERRRARLTRPPQIPRTVVDHEHIHGGRRQQVVISWQLVLGLTAMQVAGQERRMVARPRRRNRAGGSGQSSESRHRAMSSSAAFNRRARSGARRGSHSCGSTSAVAELRRSSAS